MTTDKSEGFKNTLDFLDRRLDDVGKAGRTFNDFNQTISFGISQVCSIVNSKVK